MIKLIPKYKGNKYSPITMPVKFGDGGEMSTKEKIELGASFLPVVGTIMDFKNLYDHPSWENAGWATLSLGSDLLGASILKGAIRASKVARASAVTAKLVHRSRHIEGAGQVANSVINSMANAILIGIDKSEHKK